MKKLLRLLPRQKSILGAIAAGLVAYKHFKIQQKRIYINSNHFITQFGNKSFVMF